MCIRDRRRNLASPASAAPANTNRSNAISDWRRKPAVNIISATSRVRNPSSWSARRNSAASVSYTHLCYLGSLTKALADAIEQLGVREQVVIFKKKAADVNLNCELHDYADEQLSLIHI